MKTENCTNGGALDGHLLVRLLTMIDEARDDLTDPEDWIIIYPEPSSVQESFWVLKRKSEFCGYEGPCLDIVNAGCLEVLAFYAMRECLKLTAAAQNS